MSILTLTCIKYMFGYLMIINCFGIVYNNRTEVSSLIIDAAPSVVSYQGSSQTYAHLVISPRGRALGYVAPLNLNHTVHHTEKVRESFDYLDIRPVYKPS